MFLESFSPIKNILIIDCKIYFNLRALCFKYVIEFVCNNYSYKIRDNRHIRHVCQIKITLTLHRYQKYMFFRYADEIRQKIESKNN